MNNETVLGLTKTDKVILVILPPILGALLGWFMPVIVDWVMKLPMIPFEGVFDFISSFESFWVSIIGLIIGAIAGMIFTVYAFNETLKIIITDEKVNLMLGNNEHTFLRKDISAVFMEKKKLIILDSEGRELFRGVSDSKASQIAEAFLNHRYPWQEKDPFDDQYMRWVENLPGFSQHANALLNARERAIKDDNEEEAAVLRKDLAKLGVVIRDDDKRQYVRIVESEMK